MSDTITLAFQKKPFVSFFGESKSDSDPLFDNFSGPDAFSNCFLESSSDSDPLFGSDDSDDFVAYAPNKALQNMLYKDWQHNDYTRVRKMIRNVLKSENNLFTTLSLDHYATLYLQIITCPNIKPYISELDFLYAKLILRAHKTDMNIVNTRRSTKLFSKDPVKELSQKILSHPKVTIKHRLLVNNLLDEIANKNQKTRKPENQKTRKPENQK